MVETTVVDLTEDVEPLGWLFPPEQEEGPEFEQPGATWGLRHGTAYVYYGKDTNGRYRDHLARPVILSDGFQTGPTKPYEAWVHLGGDKPENAFSFIRELRDRGYDLVILGYTDRSASILVNVEAAIDVIKEANKKKAGKAPLLVGGFSMGGLVTRYALARLETDEPEYDHQTSVYLSYDTPHHGAWVPVSLQTFAHFIKKVSGLTGPSDHINSDAARELLWRHIPDLKTEPRQDPLRTKFLDELKRVGWWPGTRRSVRKLGVGNGVADGNGNGVPAGVDAMRVTTGWFARTALRSQSDEPDQVVARLRFDLLGLGTIRADVRTAGFPALDSAPGGTLGGFPIAADSLKKLPLTTVHLHKPDLETCFVPSISAVALRDHDLGSEKDLHVDINGLQDGASELDEYVLDSAENRAHALITDELGKWILERLPEG